MVVSTAKMNARQYFQLGEDPPGIRLELVNGEVAVSPSPTPNHSYTVTKLITLLSVYTSDNGLGELYCDVDTLLDEYNVRRPDLLFFSNENLHLVGDKYMEGPPDLAIEVISPSSIEVDREDKFEQYRAAKVRYYWIIDPALQTVEGWELKRSKYVQVGRAQGIEPISLPPFPALEIPLKDLWRKRRSNG